ncbi:four-carbon acid sugar kinase family protein [uncultured Arthrobacter sp.]|uniref:four-carbon acid sugar kinase family protein n=1 Tax=uncultured Arthrobacter sp. TaxID=114050 RepID=UPI0037DC28C6
MAAARTLKSRGVQQLYFKYCSTFDSTAEGNIGPAADAMRNHPLAPMTDSSVPRLLQAQTKNHVGHIGYSVIEAGAPTVQSQFRTLSDQGAEYAVVDTLSDRQLAVLGAALLDHPLVTGGSGLVGGLAVARGFQVQPESAGAARPAGLAAVIAGSCSEMTNVQIETFRQFRPCFLVDPVAIAEGHDVVTEALLFARENLSDGPILIHSAASPQEVTSAQRQLGRVRAAAGLRRKPARYRAAPRRSRHARRHEYRLLHPS